MTSPPVDLQTAVDTLRAGDLARAEPMLQAMLAADPAQPDALHFLGVLRHLQGRADEAQALIRAAITAAPGHAGMHTNLGNVLHESGHSAEAAQAFEQAAALDPASAQPWCNLGTVWRALGDLQRARRAWQRAADLEPDHPHAWYGLSQVLIELGEVGEGLRANSRAVTLWPRETTSREQVLRALVILDRRDEAAQLYREWLADEPDNPVPRHQLAAVLGDAQGTPERADDAYVETVFDSFAPQFDARLASLQYRAPELLAEAWLRRAAPRPGSLDIADLGCGTGLCGPLLRPWARCLTGLDLSAGMLVRARARGLYDALFKVELRHYLQNERHRHDLLASADTLCYFGPLDGVMADAAGALRPGGWLVFTVEAADEQDSPHRIRSSGRYAHARSYLLQALHGAGLRDAACEPATLRMEAGAPVAGWVVSARAG